MRTRPLLIASAAIAIALPAIAQQVGADGAAGGSAGIAQPQPSTAPADPGASPDEGGGQVVTPPSLQPQSVQPPIEYPGWARRDPWVVGKLDPVADGLGDNPWGDSSGAFLSTLMRRMQTPIASRWVHIALRDALLAKAHAPRDVNPVDWVAERSWLLLRMGEADAAAMLVDAVDTDRFTPKMVQVAVQTRLANADAAGLCPLESGIRKYEPRIRQFVQAMCASLAGDTDSASAQIDNARRFGRIGGIDLSLAQKMVGAAGSGRAATIDWEPVDSLSAWRFGLSAATGMMPPDRLMNAASPQLRAFARAGTALFAAAAARFRTHRGRARGLFFAEPRRSLFHDLRRDRSQRPSVDRRLADCARRSSGRTRRRGSMRIRHMLGIGKQGLQKEAARALVARAATLVAPDAKLAKDAPELISAMLAAGYDQAAARWIPAVNGMDDEEADRCWAMLALAAPNIADVSSEPGQRLHPPRQEREQGAQRLPRRRVLPGSAGSAPTRPIRSIAATGFGLGTTTSWTQMVDASAGRGQAATVLVLTGTGFQTPNWDKVPAAHLYHAITALERTGQDFTARMIAAEALSRT